MAELNDAEHDFILNNPEADRWIAKQAVRRAIRRGMDPAKAERVYGYREPSPEPEVEDLNRIAGEIIRGNPPERPNTPREAEIRAEMTEEIGAAKDWGRVMPCWTGTSSRRSV